MTPSRSPASTASDDGRADRAHHRYPRDRGLLDDLERRAAGDLQHGVGARHATGEQLLPDHLVDRVVAADVLADRAHGSPSDGEQPGRVETAGPLEHPLGLPKPVWQRHDHVGGTANPVGTTSQRTAMSSSDALPQTPHELVA